MVILMVFQFHIFLQVCLPLRAALIWTKSKAVVVRIIIFIILNQVWLYLFYTSPPPSMGDADGDDDLMADSYL